MSKTQSLLEKARSDAQELHKSISANITKAGNATWADVKAAQAVGSDLAARMKAVATDQADATRTGIIAAVARLEAAGQLVEDKAVSAKDSIKHANDLMLSSAHQATQSLSAAVADARTKAAKAIAPKGSRG